MFKFASENTLSGMNKPPPRLYAVESSRRGRSVENKYIPSVIPLVCKICTNIKSETQ